MNLRPSVDASCRPSKLHIEYRASSRKADKASANRRYRRALKGIVSNIHRGQVEWDDVVFDLPALTNWDID